MLQGPYSHGPSLQSTESKLVLFWKRVDKCESGCIPHLVYGTLEDHRRALEDHRRGLEDHRRDLEDHRRKMNEAKEADV